MALEIEQRSLETELVSLERAISPAPGALPGIPPLTANSPAPQKLALFRRLFAGREDVFPLRWQNPKTNKSGYAPAYSNEWVPNVCRKPQMKCGECPHQAFISFSDEILLRHLGGSRQKSSSNADFVAGVCPLLPDKTCRFLAVDFDDDDWTLDARAYLETCRALSVTAALERSRSGAGGHVWIFFADPLPARLARHLGSFLLTETMERRPEIGFASYDRLFPSQDTLPLGGFGNLIALPLQSRARLRETVCSSTPTSSRMTISGRSCRPSLRCRWQLWKRWSPARRRRATRRVTRERPAIHGAQPAGGGSGMGSLVEPGYVRK